MAWTTPRRKRSRTSGVACSRAPRAGPSAATGGRITSYNVCYTKLLRFRNLLPRGVKLTPEDIWERCAYILSVKIQDPQFAGQTKERLSSRQCAAFVSGVVKDAFSLWLV